MSTISPATLADLRAREFPISAERAYLNTATQGPLPSRSRRAVEQALERSQHPGRTAGVADAAAALARQRIARLLHVDERDLVFTANTTHGLNICAAGIDWRPGDNVVLPDNEFPSLMVTWLRLEQLGVEVRRVAWQGAGPSVDQLMAAVDARTRAVSCSAVAWDSGYRIDLEGLGRRCEQAGCLLIVDGIQAVGVLDLDPRALRISALAFHGYKWLMADFGGGALYVAPEALDRIRPTFVGEQAVASPEPPLAWREGAQRYAAGGTNTFGLTALAASLELLAEIGQPAVEAHARALAEQLVAGLARHPAAQLVSSDDPALRSAITVFTLGDRERDGRLVDQLAAQGIDVALRRRGVRVSPHIYSAPEEIERLLAALGAA